MDMVDIKDIYEEYAAEMKHFFNLSGKSILSYNRFCWLIRQAFSLCEDKRLQKRKSQLMMLSLNRFLYQYICIQIRTQGPARSVALYQPYAGLHKALISVLWQLHYMGSTDLCIWAKRKLIMLDAWRQCVIQSMQ